MMQILTIILRLRPPFAVAGGIDGAHSAYAPCRGLSSGWHH
jgi:hypothetical protein